MVVDPAAGSGWQPFRVLMVCTANRVRSAMAERMLRRDLGAAAGAGRIEVRGAGTRTIDGEPMLAPAAAELERRGIDASDFASRALTEQVAGLADLVLTATREHRSAVLELAPLALRRTFTLREFAALVASEPVVRALRQQDGAGQGAAGQAAGSSMTGPAAALRDLVRLAVRYRGSIDLAASEYDVEDPAGLSDRHFAYAAGLIEQASMTISRAMLGVAGR